MKKIKVISCVITISIMALIFFFSSQTATESSRTSTGLTTKIADFIASIFNLDNSDVIVRLMHGRVRKTAHFAMFFALGISASSSVYLLFGYKKLKLFLVTLVFCILYAITDEIHQIFVPGRAAMIKDVIIDSSGAIVGIAVFSVIKNTYLRRKRHEG